MPVAFLRENGAAGFAPVARPRFLLGSDLDCDLVELAPDVADHHATVRYRRGEYLLKAEEGCSLWVQGERVPMISLRDGDAFQLSPSAPPWCFRSRVEGSFWPPELQVGEAWLSHPAFDDPEHGPLRFGDGPPVGTSDPFRCRMATTPYGPWIVRHLGPVQEPAEANDHLRFLASLGGAPHPSLAPLVDGGVAPHQGKPWRWMATRLVEGLTAERLVEWRETTARRVIEILKDLASALHHLHHRGVVHCDVAPDNVVVSGKDPAVLIDYGDAWSAESARPSSSDRTGLTGYTAPEVIAKAASLTPAPSADVYGLAATGFALLTGAPPRANEDSKAALLRARREALERWRLDRDATLLLLEILLGGLAEDPAARPDAGTCRRGLTLAEAHAGYAELL